MKKFTCALLVGMLVLTLAVGVSAAIPYDNMIGLYDMEGTFKDAISDKDGTLKNGASLVSDPERGGVLYLNNEDVVSPGELEGGYEAQGQHAVLAAPHIPDSDAMTISIWFKITDDYRTWARVIDLGDAKAQEAIANGETATVGPNRFVNISPTNGSYTIGTVNINDSSEGIPNNRDRVFAELVDTDVWVHAVFVIDADSGNPDTLYINGTAFQSTHGGEFDDPEEAVFSPRDILAAAEGVSNGLLGRSRYENNGDQIFNGYIDDVAIFDIALNADQVKELMNAKSSDLRPAAVVEEEPAPVVEPEAPAAADETPAPAATTAPVQTSAPATGDITFVILLAVLSVSGFAVIKTRKVK